MNFEPQALWALPVGDEFGFGKLAHYGPLPDYRKDRSGERKLIVPKDRPRFRPESARREIVRAKFAMAHGLPALFFGITPDRLILKTGDSLSEIAPALGWGDPHPTSMRIDFLHFTLFSRSNRSRRGLWRGLNSSK